VIGCIDDERQLAEHRARIAAMSDEQKEYEAEKLMRHIDQLMKTGAIQPATIGEDGRPQVLTHVLEMAEKYGGGAKQDENKECDSD
jgi:hypothetical protein